MSGVRTKKWRLGLVAALGWGAVAAPAAPPGPRIGPWAPPRGPCRASTATTLGPSDSGSGPAQPSSPAHPRTAARPFYTGPAYGAVPAAWQGRCQTDDAFPATAGTGK